MSESDVSDVPDEIERVIEGGADDRDISDKENDDEDKNKTDENKEKEKVRKKTGPRIVLNPARLKGPGKGLGIMESFFGDIKLHGKGREKEDLDEVMQRLEHWAHRLMPRMQFDDCLKKIEKLGSKKEISNYVKRIRLGMEDEEMSSDIIQDEAPDSPPPMEDPFDQLMNSSVVPAAPMQVEVTTEQREQILRNRLLAEERRAARIKKAQEMRERFLSTQSQSINCQENVPNKLNQSQTDETSVATEKYANQSTDTFVSTEKSSEVPEIQIEKLCNSSENESELPLDVLENRSSKTIDNQVDNDKPDINTPSQFNFEEEIQDLGIGMQVCDEDSDKKQKWVSE